MMILYGNCDQMSQMSKKIAHNNMPMSAIFQAFE